MFFTIMMRDKNAHNIGQMMHDTLVNDDHMMQCSIEFFFTIFFIGINKEEECCIFS